MAVSSVAAVFTINTLLKRKQYGVLLAHGFTKSNIMAGIAAEVSIIMFSSAALSWAVKLMEFERSIDPLTLDERKWCRSEVPFSHFTGI